MSALTLMSANAGLSPAGVVALHVIEEAARVEQDRFETGLLLVIPRGDFRHEGHAGDKLIACLDDLLTLQLGGSLGRAAVIQSHRCDKDEVRVFVPPKAVSVMHGTASGWTVRKYELAPL